MWQKIIPPPLTETVEQNIWNFYFDVSVSLWKFSLFHCIKGYLHILFNYRQISAYLGISRFLWWLGDFRTSYTVLVYYRQCFICVSPPPTPTLVSVPPAFSLSTVTGRMLTPRLILSCRYCVVWAKFVKLGTIRMVFNCQSPASLAQLKSGSKHLVYWLGQCNVIIVVY